MSNLKNVVEELQNQQEGLNDVNSSIQQLIKIQTDQLKSERRQAGDDLEKQIESNRKKKAGTQSRAPAPRSFAQGLGQGTGISAVLGGVQGLFPSFAGALGGASLAGLLGKFTGRLVLGSIGFFLGKEYLDKHVDKLTNMLNLDTINIFGEDYDTSKIVSGLTGAFALVLGPAAIGAAVKRFFGGASFRNQILGGPSGGAGPRRGFGFIGRLGLGAAVLTIGSLLGDKIGELTSNQDLDDAVTAAASTAGLLMMFNPKVGVLAGLAVFAYKGFQALENYLDRKGTEALKELNKRLDTKVIPGTGGKTYNQLTPEDFRNLEYNRLGYNVAKKEANDASYVAISNQMTNNQDPEAVLEAEAAYDSAKMGFVNMSLSDGNNKKKVIDAKLEAAVQGNTLVASELANFYYKKFGSEYLAQIDNDIKRADGVIAPTLLSLSPEKRKDFLNNINNLQMERMRGSGDGNYDSLILQNISGAKKPGYFSRITGAISNFMGKGLADISNPGMTNQPSVFIDNSNSNNSTVNNNGKTSATSSGSSGSATDFDVIFDPLVIYGGGSKGVSPEY